MTVEIKILIISIIHIIGTIINLIIFDKCGVFKQAAEYGDGIRYAKPTDVVFSAFVWEVYLLLYIIFGIEHFINNFFYKKYNVKE